MKKDLNFWLSLELYLRNVVKRSPIRWQWVGVGLVGLVLFTSLLNVKNSIVGVKNTREAIELAVSRGDYETAQELFNHKSQMTNSQMVLGVDSELEDKVYPERKVERKIAELEEKLKEYPSNREIFLQLAELYGQIGNQEKSDEYREKARILDPNNVKFE